MYEIIKIASIIFSFLGSLVIAFSVKKNPGGAHQLVNGKKIPLASIYVNTFRWGISIFILGLFLQLVLVLLCE